MQAVWSPHTGSHTPVPGFAVAADQHYQQERKRWRQAKEWKETTLWISPWLLLSCLWEIMALLRYLYKVKAVHANVHLSIKITCKMTSVSLIQIYANVRGAAYDHCIFTWRRNEMEVYACWKLCGDCIMNLWATVNWGISFSCVFFLEGRTAQVWTCSSAWRWIARKWNWVGGYAAILVHIDL